MSKAASRVRPVRRHDVTSIGASNRRAACRRIRAALYARNVFNFLRHSGQGSGQALAPGLRRVGQGHAADDGGKVVHERLADEASNASVRFSWRSPHAHWIRTAIQTPRSQRRRLPADDAGGLAFFGKTFRTAYASVLWNMMILRWCGARWDRHQDMVKSEARFAAIEAQAIRLELKEEMRQAAADNARAMATMRLDTRCNEGFGPARDRTERVLGELESFIVRRKGALQGKGDEPPHPPQDIRIAYLVVDAAFFALRECRETSIGSM